MRVYYSLNKEDYLQHQLYVCTKTPKIIASRKRKWFWLTFLFLIFSVVFFLMQNNVLAIFSLLIGIATTIFYPSYERKRYFAYYKNYINDCYPERSNENSFIEFDDSFVFIKNIKSESKIEYDEFEKIVEIKDYFFLRFNQNSSLIIPKNKIENLEIVKEYLLNLTLKINIDYIQELDWKWN